jgi:hypothetical protein
MKNGRQEEEEGGRRQELMQMGERGGRMADE